MCKSNPLMNIVYLKLSLAFWIFCIKSYRQANAFGLTQAVTLAKEDIHMGNVLLQGIIG